MRAAWSPLGPPPGGDWRRRRLRGHQRAVALNHAQRRRLPLERASRGLVHHAAGPTYDRARRGARYEERAREEREDSHDRDAGAPEREPEPPAENGAEVAALVPAEREHQSKRDHDQPGAERPDVDEVAPRHHQRADDRQGRRQAERGGTDQFVQAVRDPTADVAAVPAGPEDRSEEDAQRDEAESDQLGMLVAARLVVSLRALLDALGHARLERASLATARHARLLRRRTDLPFTRYPTGAAAS